MLFRRRRNPGWMALRVLPDRIDAVHVVPGARPAVSTCESLAVGPAGPVESLRELRRMLRLERYRCTTLIEFPEYQLHHVEAPGVPDPELRQALRWSVKDLIDYPVEEAAVEVLKIPAGEDQRARNVFVVTARHQHVAGLAKLFEDAHVPLDAIDIPELAQRNLAVRYEKPARAAALLAFHSGSCWLTITGNAELLVVRRIDIALDRLLQAEPDQRGIYLDRIALELQRSFDNFDRQFGFIALSRLLLASVPTECGLKETLQANLELPVDDLLLIDAIDVARTPQLVEGPKSSEGLLALGAALRSEHADAMEAEAA